MKPHFITATIGLTILMALSPQARANNPVLAKPIESPEEHAARMAWWHEAKFGIMICWGLYSIPAGVWKGKVHATGYSEWIMFGEKIPVTEYELLAKRFNPSKFNATAWVAIAKQAGMKYMVFITKHHDGFSMFKSQLTPYNIVEATPFKRDVTLELSDACRHSGMRFGCYYSIDRDWYRPQGSNNYHQNNSWDFPDTKREDFDHYFATFAKPQVEELLTNYRPDLLWFDEIEMKTDAQVEDLYQMIRKLQPRCLVNSRIKSPRFPDRIPPPYCDYISTGDNEIADKEIGFEWENPGSMNTSYAYNANDHNWVEAPEIVFRLVDIVSKGGNYLLDVGPTAEGLIPEACIKRLTEVGGWMKINGEAIYGTSPSCFGAEYGKSTKAEDGDGDERRASPIRQWRCTTKPGKIFFHIFEWPGTKFEVAGMKSTATKAYLLADADRKSLPIAQDGKKFSVTLPATAPGKIASVLCVETR